MGVILVGGGTGAQQEVDTTPKAARVILYDALGNPLGSASNPLAVVQGSPPLFSGCVAGFRTVGSAAALQNLLTIENGNTAGSGVNVRVTGIRVNNDSTVLLAAVANEFIISRTTAMPTGGTVLTKQASGNTNQLSNASVVLRGATASDGGAASAITATGAGIMQRKYALRMVTLAGISIMPDVPFDLDSASKYIELRGQQALVIQIINPTAANNAATNNYTVSVSWQEITAS